MREYMSCAGTETRYVCENAQVLAGHFAVCLHVCCDLSGRFPLFLVYLVEQQLQRKVKLPEFITFI